MMFSRPGELKLLRLETGTVVAGVEFVEVTVDSEGLAGVAGGGLGQEDDSDVTDRGRVVSGDLWCL